MTTEEFIRANRNGDVRSLALQAGRYPGVDIPYALDQIAGWQAACRKLPSWAAVEGIVYPPHISLEQCSSELTAKYKANVLSACLAPSASPRGASAFVDLTGGFGVDFSFMARHFERVVYVERQEHLCGIAHKNFAYLGLGNAEVVCGDGVEYLHTIEHASLIFLDPARRDVHGARTYAISDCVPDVISLERELLDKADTVMLKLSPMLDIKKVIADLEPDGARTVVKEIHIVSVNNECKELLVLLSADNEYPVTVYCVNLQHGARSSVFSFPYKSSDRKLSFSFVSFGKDISLPDDHIGVERLLGAYLFEPNASIMKAGCFSVLGARYGVAALGHNSHLFVSSGNIDDFPGRCFRIKAVSSMNKTELRKVLNGIEKANITVRNFPMPVATLRKRLKLADGGNIYIFATTIERAGNHMLIICEKA